MDGNLIATIVGGVSTLIFAIIGWFIRRLLKQYDERIECIEEKQEKMSSQQTISDTKIEGIKKDMETIYSTLNSIDDKINKLVNQEAMIEIRQDIKAIGKQLQEFLIKISKQEIINENLTKQLDEIKNGRTHEK